MVSKKAKSKRVGLHKKHKIERKVKEHHRKLRKSGKGLPSDGIKKLKKDPGIPNLWPFKEALMERAKQARERRDEDEAAQKAARAKLKAKKRATALGDASGPGAMEALAADAREAGDMFDYATSGGHGGPAGGFDPRDILDARSGMADATRRKFYKDFRNVIKSADVLLEVLDARDPIGCRCTSIEDFVRTKYPDKKIILVLNKIDLVPREIVAQWRAYLRSSFPTVVFKASTQSQQRNLGQSRVAVAQASDGLLKSTEALGADALVELLKNYSRSEDSKTSITVGVFGYPNVGKSSLINSLKRSKVCKSGATAGVTRTTQVIKLDKNIKLIDCPGIVFSAATNADLILRNAINIQQLDAPETAVAAILAKCNPQDILAIYGIAPGGGGAFRSDDVLKEFLHAVAVKKGRQGHRGVPNLDAAARDVLQDWVSGRIPFHTLPPKHSLSDAAQVSADILSGFDAELDLDAFAAGTSLLVPGSEAPDFAVDEIFEDDADGGAAAAAAADAAPMEVAEGRVIALDMGKVAARQRAAAAKAARGAVGYDVDARAGGATVGQDRKRAAKAERKAAKRGAAAAEQEDAGGAADDTSFGMAREMDSDDGEGSSDGSGDAFDFARHFTPHTLAAEAGRAEASDDSGSDSDSDSDDGSGMEVDGDGSGNVY